MSELDVGLRSATELTAMLRDREISSRELLAHYLQRNEMLHDDLNAIVALDVERAEQAASAADERLVAESSAQSSKSQPLLGLPMTMKDALATAGLTTTGGAVELRDHVPVQDAECVARIRSAGAVVFGKTNLPRWSADVQAFNEIYGTTNNPWDLTCGPGGSSGGASAAVAAGLTGAELGTDIGGSVRLPAHFAGVCGHKPSFGIVPQLGYVSHRSYELSEPDVNVIGPIARSVDDLELLLDVIAGPRQDLTDGWNLQLPPARHEAPTGFRVAAHLDNPVVPVSEEVSVALASAVAALEGAGIGVDRHAWPADLDFDDVATVGLPLISAATSPGRTDAEFARLRALVDAPDVDDSLRTRAHGTAMFHRDWLLLHERREANRRKWAAFFNDFDILLAPVAHVAAFPHDHDGTLYERNLTVDGVDRPYSHLIMWTSQFGYVGLPSTVVPIGLTDRGVPVGIQIVGPHLHDRTTLAFARFIEQLLGGYQVPPLAAKQVQTR